jgi:ribosomal protein S18 acetylase RimI-like enzyme
LSAHHSAITLRRAQPEDAGFLYRVYANTRYDELAIVGWNADEVEAFLRMQFLAQDKYYRETFPASTFDVVQAGEIPIGRLYVDRQPGRLLILDIALLPEHRGRVIGTQLLTELQAKARATNQKIHIHVETYNPAQHLYHRLGFVTIGETGVYFEMMWTPDAARLSGAQM